MIRQYPFIVWREIRIDTLYDTSSKYIMHDKSILVMLFIANGGAINAEFNSHKLQNNSNASCKWRGDRHQ